LRDTIPNSSIYSVIDTTLQAIGDDQMRTALRRALVSVLCVAVVAAVASIAVATFSKIEYRNSQYGFYVSLPSTWKGYSAIQQQWTGYTNGPNGQVASEHGPEILIRHPAWTTKDPRQDIPVMVFTLAQWNAVQQEKFYISAAPIGPSELGRNSTYVFGLPPRYNYAYITGWEEVDKILQGHSFHAF
jgi:hypothetical protein